MVLKNLWVKGEWRDSANFTEYLGMQEENYKKVLKKFRVGSD
jgi:hypothetical protein